MPCIGVRKIWEAFRTAGGTDSESGEEWTMYVQTAEPYVELPNDVDIEMTISILKHGRETGHDQSMA